MWTDELLEEWERVIVREKRRMPTSARSVTAAVRQWFASTRIPPTLYRHLIAAALSADESDRAHAAACMGGDVDVLLTRNTKDFPVATLADAGVRVMNSDHYLIELLRRHPRTVDESLTNLAASRSRPAISRCELVEQLDRAGVPEFARRLGRLFGCEPTDPR